MIPIAVCDDCPQDLARSRQAVESALAQACVSVFPRPQVLLSALEDGYRPVIAVLDIQMGRIDGMELARALLEWHPACRIIFITEYLQYAPEVYAVRHSYFVLKSQLNQRMPAALAQALAEVEAQPHLSFRSQGQLHSVHSERVLYLERRLRKTFLFTSQATFQTSEHPARILAQGDLLPFCQCHQSYWVNLARVSAMSAEAFRMENGAQVPISRAYRKSAREQFFRFLNRELETAAETASRDAPLPQEQE